MDKYSIAPMLREIGRGRDGSKPLDREQARELMHAIVEQRVSDLQLGAALIALRMKGETAGEIAGFLDALQTATRRIESPRPVVVIPTYNGARLLPNLVPLLALLLARDGVAVLLHGQASEPHGGVRTAKTRLIGRVTTLDVLAEFDDFAPCPSFDEVGARWARQQPAFVPLEVIAPELSRLIALRRELGVRNVAHTLAKLLRPVDGAALLLSSYTHGEFGKMLAELFTMTAATALVQRGTEGEAVINPQRPQPLELWRGGALLRTVEVVAERSTDWPAVDAPATAAWTRDVMDGKRAVPAPIAAQVALIREWVASSGALA